MASNASICSFTTIVANSAAIAEPILPAKRKPVIIGANSVVSASPVAPEIKLSALKIWKTVPS